MLHETHKAYSQIKTISAALPSVQFLWIKRRVLNRLWQAMSMWQRQNRISKCSWLFPLVKRSWLIPKTRREGEGNKALWAAIAKLPCHGACKHLNPRKWLHSLSKGIQMLLLWQLYCADPLQWFFICSLQAKTLRSPTRKHYNCYPSPSQIAHPFCTDWGEQRCCNTEHPGDQTTETSAKIPKGHVLIGLNNVSNRI